MKRKYKFFFHYNKPASTRAGKPQVTVHFRGACHILDNVLINVPTYGKLREKQPRFVIAGECDTLTIDNGVGTLS